MDMSHEAVIKRIKEEHDKLVIDCIEKLKKVDINYDDLHDLRSAGYDIAHHEKRKAEWIIKETAEKMNRLRAIINYDMSRKAHGNDFDNEFVERLRDGVFDP